MGDITGNSWDDKFGFWRAKQILIEKSLPNETKGF